MQAITSHGQNNTSSQGKASEHADEVSNLSLTLVRGLLESVVCRHWRGRTHTSAILVLWNALSPPDLQSRDLARLKQHLSSLTALRSGPEVLRPHSLAHREPWESSYLFYGPRE